MLGKMQGTTKAKVEVIIHIIMKSYKSLTDKFDICKWFLVFWIYNLNLVVLFILKHVYLQGFDNMKSTQPEVSYLEYKELGQTVDDSDNFDHPLSTMNSIQTHINGKQTYWTPFFQTVPSPDKSFSRNDHQPTFETWQPKPSTKSYSTKTQCFFLTLHKIKPYSLN